MKLTAVLEQVRIGDTFYRESKPEILYERIGALIERKGLGWAKLEGTQYHYDWQIMPSLSDEESDDQEQDDGDYPETFPEHLFDVPGFVNELTQYINDTSHVVQPIYSLAAALAFQALLCAQNVKDPTGIRTNPYIIVAGRSASGKDKGREVIKKKLTGLQNTPAKRFYESFKYICDGAASKPALVNRLAQNLGALLWLWDEMEKEFVAVDTSMRFAFTGRRLRWTKRDEALQSQPSIWWRNFGMQRCRIYDS